MNTEQELYSALIVRLNEKYKGSVFDGDMPPEGTAYPFIYVGESQSLSDSLVKGMIFGQTSISVHVWHDAIRKRGDLSTIMFNIKRIARSITQTSGHGWCLSGIDEQILTDLSTNEPLLHGVLSFTYKNWRR